LTILKVCLRRIKVRDRLFKMQRAILTLSKNNDLVEQIRSNLEEGGRYYVQGVTSAHGALAMVRHRTFDLTILDLEQCELTGPQLIYNLKKIQPELKVVVYNPAETINSSELKRLPVDGILGKPFFAPELSDLLKALFSPIRSRATQAGSAFIENNAALVWHTNPLRIWKLSQLVSRTNALTATIFIQGKPAIVADDTSPVVLKKLCEFIDKIWTGYKGQEVYRYLRGEDDFGPCLVYVLPVSTDMVMVFTYPSSFDLRSIRLETAKLRDSYFIERFSNQPKIEPSTLLGMGRPIEDNEFKNTINPFIEELDDEAAPHLQDGGSQWVTELEDSISDSTFPPFDESLHPQPAEADGSNLAKFLADTTPLSDSQGVIPLPADKQGLGNILPSILEEEIVTESSHETHMPNLQAAIEEDLRSTHEEEMHQEPVDLSVILPWETVKEKVTKEETPSPSNEPDRTTEGKQRMLRIPFARAYNVYHCVIVPRSSQQLLTRELVIRRRH